MKTFFQLFFKGCVLLCLLISILSCGERQLSEPATSSPLVLTVCDIMENPQLFHGQKVKIIGTLRGFHQLVLSSEKCPGESNVLLVDVSYTVLTPYFKGLNKQGAINEFVGETLLVGTIEVNGGLLVNYGDYLYDAKSNRVVKTPKDMVVNKLTSVSVISFAPTLTFPNDMIEQSNP